MQILIVAATFAECKGLLKEGLMPTPSGIIQKNILKDTDADLLITDVGQVATAFHLGKLLPVNHYDQIINIGLAGSFKADIPLGTVVEVVQDEFADLGVEDHDVFIDLFDLGLLNPNVSPFNQKKLWPLPRKVKIPDGVKLPPVTGVTVNTVHGNEVSINKFRKQFPSDVESMEGAAVFYACNMVGVSSLQLRAISNYVEPRNKPAWQMETALTALWKITSQILIHKGI